MGEAGKQQKLDSLRQREVEGRLTGAERAELEQLIQEIEGAEAEYLRPATERARADRLRLEAQNAALEAVIQRRADLARRLQQFLAEAKAERHAIEKELARILSGTEAASGAEQ